MTFEDPFFVVKEEVLKALNKTITLYRRWSDLQAEPITINLLKEEVEWTTTELRNSLRSIEWDLEDLEDTINILSLKRNPSKFKLDTNELNQRRKFIEDTKTEVKSMREKLSYSKAVDKDKTSRQPLIENLTTAKMGGGGAHSSTKYSKLENQTDSPEHVQFVKNSSMMQNRMIVEQDDQLELISDSIGTLKNMSRQIGIELDEQDEMLNELHNEIEQTDSRINSTVKKVSKVLHLSNDRSQWIAIGLLSGLLILILILFMVL
ncbi:hypothetical protein V9T40_014371 [Parthenolecanium corni]|uniref:t-SNARE coiled-coil homology domain-containing protein n=1 Tax=Parthenolecanium corni TaxID=536013 RepID=A0AAN9T349_9HEMI